MKLALTLDRLPIEVQEAFAALTKQFTAQFALAHTDDDVVAHQILWAYHNQTQSHTTSAAWEAVNFNSEEDLRGVRGWRAWPTGSHDTVTRPDRFLVPGERGSAKRILRVRCRITFAANGTGNRGIRFMVNDAQRSTALRVPGTAAVDTHLTVCDTLLVDPGDAVHVQAFQSSGGALNIGDTAVNTRNSVEWELL